MNADAGRADSDDYLQLLLGDIPLIDTRAPVEFARGAFEQAVNLPLMSDAERAEVGTCYKAQGQSRAIELGHRLVSGASRRQRVAAWVDFAERHPHGYLYCFRGGLRSQICQQWMAEAGAPYPRVIGGYKALRRTLIDALERVCDQAALIIVAGQTGCAKTELLRGLPGAVDLEALAHHRGSAFGRRPGPQPAQIDFENALATRLLRCFHQRPDRPIVLEDESRLIGQCVLPPALQTAMAAAPVVLVEADLEARVEHTYANYILHKRVEWQDYAGPEAGFERFAEDLRQSLQRIRKRLGGPRYRRLAQLQERALAAHRHGDGARHRDWIGPLLRDYYDPMYDYQLEAKAHRVVMRGDRASVRRYLNPLAESGDVHDDS